MAEETKLKIKNKIVKHMKSIGVYRVEYEHMIDVYSGMLHQYQAFEKQFAENGYQCTEQHTNNAGAVNERKVPVLTAMESLRKDIATYSDKLQLNAKANKDTAVTIKNDSSNSKNDLDKFMSGLAV